jgi:hypothetical protein
MNNHKSNLMKKLIPVFCVLLFSCGKGPVNFEGGSADHEALLSMPVLQKHAVMQTVSNTVAERKLIKNGSLDFVTGKIEETRVAVEKLCKQYHAYIATENQNNYNDRIEYRQEIRVPASAFDALMADIEAMGERIEARSINTQDVTEEFIDVEARLKTKRELESRYLSLLKQAKSVADILSIESQIAATRADIESMQGRLNYLTNQVSYSTLEIMYHENTIADFGFASKFVVALRNGWDNLLMFLTELASLWPFVVIGFFLMWRLRKWKFRPFLRKSSPKEGASA